MGMPITVEVRDGGAEPLVERVFDWFGAVDGLFSTYKPESAISRLNHGELSREDAPELVQRVLRRLL
jgi:FAD:protein FMN transferase